MELAQNEHLSTYSLISCIEVTTGFLVDFEVLSKNCRLWETTAYEPLNLLGDKKIDSLKYSTANKLTGYYRNTVINNFPVYLT